MRYEVKGVPFMYKGAVDVSNCKTSLDCLVKSNLNWDVAKCELAAKIPVKLNESDDTEVNSLYGGFVKDSNFYTDCPIGYAVYRTDCNIPLGIVKEKYTPVQNRDCFKFFDDAIGKDKAVWQTAGFFNNGQRVFISAKLPYHVMIDGSDPIENYLVLITSHDGSMGVKALLTPIRIICQNTLNAAIRCASSYVSFKHTASVHKNINRSAELLGICKEKILFVEEQFNQMAKLKYTDNQAREIWAKVILTETEIQNIKNTGHTLQEIFNRYYLAIEDSGISSKKVNTLSTIEDYYFNGVGQKDYVGTAWGVYNAVNGYYSNVDNVDGIKRMDSLLFGDKAKKIEVTGNLILK